MRNLVYRKTLTLRAHIKDRHRGVRSCILSLAGNSERLDASAAA